MGFATLNRHAVNVAPAPSPPACEIYVSMGRSRSHPFADPGTTLEPFPCNGIPDGVGDMGQDSIGFYYSRLSPEDQRTFDRWLKANAIVGAIFATGLIAMALTGSGSVGPQD